MGISSIWATYHFYKLSERSPALTYAISPVKPVVVGANDAKGLSITVNGKPLSGKLTAAQVMIWNAGREPIDRATILKPLLLVVRNTKILQATVMYQTRDVVNVQLNTKYIDNGAVAVSWDIMENEDGGVVQLVYEGDADTSIVADATIKGQQEGIHYISGDKLGTTPSTPAEEAMLSKFSAGQKIGIFLIALVFTLMTIYFISSAKHANDRTTSKVLNWMMFFAGFIFLLTSGHAVYTSGIRLPFSFCGSCGAPATAESHVTDETDPAYPIEKSDRAPERSEHSDRK